MLGNADGRLPVGYAAAEVIPLMQPIKIFLLSILVASLVACATIPAQEMSDARQAIQAAEDAGASAHSPRALDHARFLLEQAQIELAERDYASARRSANASKEAAIQAREAATDVAPPPTHPDASSTPPASPPYP